MPPLILEGDNLGKRHRHFNEQVNETLKYNISFDTVLSQCGDSDIDELFKIDIASHYKNVDYILKVLKSEDMLYVSRAIKKSTWLVIDNQYAHIVNPQYLSRNLFPCMTSKAISKLLLHIRLHLKDEKRAEEFYIYYHEIDAAKAIKWLPNCSFKCVRNSVVEEIKLITPTLFKRLCEKYPNIFKDFFHYFSKINNDKLGLFFKNTYYDVSSYLLKTHTDMYLDEIENNVAIFSISSKYIHSDSYLWPKLRRRQTAVLLKTCPQRILSNLKTYIPYIDKKTLAKFLGPDNIQDFILNLFKSKDIKFWLCYNNLKPFINHMPKEGKFDFLKKMFIDNIFEYDDSNEKPIEMITYVSKKKSNPVMSKNIYQWYRHAPFDVAFLELTKLIETESSSEEREAILRVILTTACRNKTNVLTLLQYYHEKHCNEPIKHKINFLNAVISVTKTHDYDDKSWKILNELFHSAEIYIESDTSAQKCVQSIIIYRILHNLPIPEIIENKFKFSSLKKMKNKFTKTQGDEIFKYLFNYVKSKINLQALKNQSDVNKVVSFLENIMNLLLDWDKDLVNYPTVLNKIKELVVLKHGQDIITINLENIYNKNKSWRKYMFEQSLLLSRKDEVYLNALKHDPTLFDRYPTEVELARLDDKVVLLHFLAKLKIYWDSSLAKDWANAYIDRINQSNGHRALTLGLCKLLTRKELLSLFEKFAPDDSKISWIDIDKNMLSLRKNFARLMHVARPPPPLTSILPYTLGDYLIYALPSLNAILYNASSEKSLEYIPKLLNGTVSLQKHGIRMAFAKLPAEDLKNIFSDTWKSTTNASIRAVLFQLTFKLLCREKNHSRITDLYCLLDMFIDNLSSEENGTIYYLLKNVNEVPKSVRAQYCIKSYNYLKSMPARVNCQRMIETVSLSTYDLMDSIDLNFVESIILEYIDTWVVTKKFVNIDCEYTRDMKKVIASYVLCTNNDSEQDHRFDKVFRPFMRHIFALWDEIWKREKEVKMYFESCIGAMAVLMEKHLSQKRYVVPLKVFEQIKKELESNVSFDENYLTITSATLIVSYIQCYNKIKSQLEDVKETHEHAITLSPEKEKELRKQMYIKISPLLAAETINLLKHDMEKYSPLILGVFSTAFSTYCPVIYKHDDEYCLERELMKDANCILGYILAIRALPCRCYDEEKNKKLNEIRRVIEAHPSLETHNMPPLILEGDNLGKRHRHFNEQVNETLKNNISFDTVLSQCGDSDIDELFKIDIASHYKNVDYILKVLKSEDMLYVSRAIKKSTWLVIENQYAHIVNPQYLSRNLFPYMTSKAISKLLLHIRLHLKDEKRAEEFYIYYHKIDAAKAIKWLPNCSFKCVKNSVVKEIELIKPRLFKKIICEKYPSICKIFFHYLSKRMNYMMGYFPKKMYYDLLIKFLSTRPDMCLDELENLSKYDSYLWPKLGRKQTAVLMKKRPERILSNLTTYLSFIDKKTLAKSLGRENIQDFILNLFKKKDFKFWLCYNNLKPFIEHMPTEGKFEFLKKMFIDKNFEYGDSNEKPVEMITYLTKRKSNRVKSENIYQWYRHAPFEVAFLDLTKLIETESSSEEREAILRVILTTACCDNANILTLLQYYHNKHINEPFKYKINFLNAIISVKKTHDFDDKSWKILDELFHSAEVYTESDTYVQKCVESIIVYKVLHKQPIPETIEKKFKFSTLKFIKIKLTETQRYEIFKYLFNYIELKIKLQSLNNQSDVNKVVSLLENIMNLLVDWNKDLVHYPTVWNKINELVVLKHDQDIISINLENIYNKNKCWRKYMFEQSLLLSRKDEVYLNALKHDPTLFDRYPTEVELARRDDKVVLLHFLAKLKIYWGSSLAKDWANAYVARINQSNGHRALTHGLCKLLTRNELLPLFETYAPDVSKISWNDIDKNILSLRKNFARLMHITKPHPPLTSILSYTRGKYLIYALPSLEAILYNVSSEKSFECVSELLNGTVPLQKHAIRMAFAKLQGDDLINIFSDTWKSTTNASVRTLIFQLTFKQLCRQKNQSKIIDFYCLLETFIDDLSGVENETIFEVFKNVIQVPKYVRARYCVKCCKYLKSMPAKYNCQRMIETISLCTHDLMDSIDPVFVECNIIEFISNWIITKKLVSIDYWYTKAMLKVIASYILCTTNESEQEQRFDRVFRPFMRHIFAIWDEIWEREREVKMYFKSCIDTMARLMEKHLSQKKYVVPLKVFEHIKVELESNLPFDENYVIITSVKVIVSYVQCYNKIKCELEDVEQALEDGNTLSPEKEDELCKQMYNKISPLLAAETIKILEYDMEEYSPLILRVFSTAFSTCPVIYRHDDEYCLERELIKDVNCILGYILAIGLLPYRCRDEVKYKKLDEIRSVIVAHPSIVVRLCYYEKYPQLSIVSYASE